MINHECKIIELGFGDVAVGNNLFGLTFRTIKPPQPLGEVLMRDDPDLEFIGEIVNIEITTIKEAVDFSKKLKTIEDHMADYFEFAGWKFLFAPNSDISALVVRTHFKWVLDQVLRCCAC